MPDWRYDFDPGKDPSGDQRRWAQWQQQSPLGRPRNSPWMLILTIVAALALSIFCLCYQ